MYQASAQFHEAILDSRRKFRAKLQVGESEITEGFRSIKLYAQTSGDNFITIGGAFSAYIEVELWQPSVSLENSEVKLSIGLLVGEDMEWVPLGLFTVQGLQIDDGVVKFTAYDRIQSKMSGAYFSELVYPVDGKTVLNEISLKTGVSIHAESLPDGILIQKRKTVSESGVDDEGNEIVNTSYVNPFDGYTYREALGYIAQFYGRTAVAGRTGDIDLRWYDDAEYTVLPGRYYDDLVLGENVFTVEAISCQTGETTLRAGNGIESIQFENPIMTKERLDAIYEQVEDLQFLPAGFSFLGDMRLDLGDIIAVQDKKGNTVKVPVMYQMLDYDGGLITALQSFGGRNAEAEGVKGPTAQKLDRTYAELFLVKELVGNKASFDYVHAIDADFKNVKADYGEYKNLVTEEFEAVNGQFSALSSQYATIDLANIATGAIKTAMIDTGAIQSAQIADGAITNLKVAGDLDATKISAGTLSVDRLIIRGSEKSLVYELNNITGAIQGKNVDTLNGEILTPRTINADRIVANSITGNEIKVRTITANNIVANSITGDEIAAGTITSSKIDTVELFSQNITATDLHITGDSTFDGTLNGATGSFSGKITATAGKIGFFDISLDYLEGNTVSIYAGDSFNGGSITMSGASNFPGCKTKYMATGIVWQVDGQAKWSARLQNVDGTVQTEVDVTTVRAEEILEGKNSLSSKYAAKIHDHTSISGTAAKLAASGNISKPMVFNWSGQSGQPAWVWGGNSEANQYVFNPANFNVSSATKLLLKGIDTIKNDATGLDTPSNWTAQGISGHYYSAKRLESQPTQYGYVFNITQGNPINGAGQLWFPIQGGTLCHREGNSLGWEKPWKKILDETNYMTMTGLNYAIGTDWKAITSYSGDGTTALGTSSNRYTNVYAKGGAVLTSDENEKDILSGITDPYEEVFMDLKPILYKWKNFGNELRPHDRIHCGLGAQSVLAAARKHGLNEKSFAVVCRDDLDEATIDGRTERYGLAYEELHGLEIHMIQKNVMEIQGMKTRQDILEGKLQEALCRIMTQENLINDLRTRLRAQA